MRVVAGEERRKGRGEAAAAAAGQRRARARRRTSERAGRGTTRRRGPPLLPRGMGDLMAISFACPSRSHSVSLPHLPPTALISPFRSNRPPRNPARPRGVGGRARALTLAPRRRRPLFRRSARTTPSPSLRSPCRRLASPPPARSSSSSSRAPPLAKPHARARSLSAPVPAQEKGGRGIRRSSLPPPPEPSRAEPGPIATGGRRGRRRRD